MDHLFLFWREYLAILTMMSCLIQFAFVGMDKSMATTAIGMFLYIISTVKLSVHEIDLFANMNATPAHMNLTYLIGMVFMWGTLHLPNDVKISTNAKVITYISLITLAVLWWYVAASLPQLSWYQVLVRES